MSFAALRACVRNSPAWLEDQIQKADKDQEPVSELAYLLANLEMESGEPIWRRTKATLFEKVAHNKLRSVTRCIWRFRDRDEVPRLEGWLAHREDHLAPNALLALAILDIARALAGLDRLHSWDLYTTHHWWLPEFLIRRPDHTRQALRQLMQCPEREIWAVAQVYQEYENEMDSVTLDLLLDRLEELVSKCVAEPPPEREVPMWRPLALLAQVTRYGLLEMFKARIGTQLERKLTEIACSWVGRGGINYDHELENARKVLLKIHGVGFTELVNCELKSQDQYSQLHGVEWAVVAPDRVTRRLLKELAVSQQLFGNREYPVVQHYAMKALAAIGENESLVEAILQWGFKIPEGIAELRYGFTPMTDSELAKALLALEDAETRTNAMLAIGVSGRSDLAPRLRDIFRTAPPESELALAAILALDDLADRDPETVRLLAIQLGIPLHRRQASVALLHMETDEALNPLKDRLKADSQNALGNVEQLLAINLSMRPATRQVAAEVMWAEMKRDTNGCEPNEFLSGVAELNNSEVHERLLHEAYAPEGTYHRVGRKIAAIQGLGKIDSGAAFAAAEIARGQCNQDRERFPALLMCLDPSRAILLLCRGYSSESQTGAQWAIGRALRRSGQPSLVLDQLRQMLQDHDPVARQSAADLAGWQGSNCLRNELKSTALDDASDDVRAACHTAMRRQQDGIILYELMAAMASSSGPCRWSLLEAILDLGDPYLLASRDDPLTLHQFLKDLPPVFAFRSNERLKKRIEEVKKKAEELDRRKRQDD